MSFHAYKNPVPVQERYYLCVPFDDKDVAKALGARWDAEARGWYASRHALNAAPQLGLWLPPGELKKKFKGAVAWLEANDPGELKTLASLNKTKLQAAEQTSRLLNKLAPTHKDAA